MKFKIIMFYMAGLLLFYANISFAVCTMKTKVTAQIAFSNVVVQRDAPVGTVLATWQHPATNTTMATCNSPFTMFGLMSYLGGQQTSLEGVYATNIPGVGFKAPGVGTGYEYLNPPSSNRLNISSTYNVGDNMTTTFQLIKTGPITSGSLSATVAATQYLDDAANITSQYTMNNAKVTALACSLQTPNLIFPLGDVPVSNFGTAVGTIPSGAQNTQNLGLSCDAGANINITLNGVQNPDVSTTSVLALTGQGNAGVAKGVGVQFLYNGSPLILNNRIVLKQSAGGQETFPIIARYYQTRSSVTPGNANASATLDITYQ